LAAELAKILRNSRYSNHFKFEPITSEKVRDKERKRKLIVLLVFFSKYQIQQIKKQIINHHRVVAVQEPARTKKHLDF